MVLKQIRTRNIQNHREVVIDLPPSGLIVFTGDNSNGKSVIRKVTKMLISGAISDPHERADKVNRESVSGEVEYIRDDDARLLCHIQREANATFVELHIPGEEPVRRYLADKSYMELVARFGWHYDPVTEVTLQIARANEALLFYTTPLKTNGRVLASALTDPSAEVAAANLQNTIKETKAYRDRYSVSLATLYENLRKLEIEDTSEMEAKLGFLKRAQQTLSSVYFPSIPEIHKVPDVNVVDLYKPTIPKIKYPRIYEATCRIPDILGIARELRSLQDMRCPTCGRGFDEHAGENSVCV